MVKCKADKKRNKPHKKRIAKNRFGITIPGYRVNPECLDSQVHFNLAHFSNRGDLMWPPARKAYEEIYRELYESPHSHRVLDFGCGIGIGTYILQNTELGIDAIGYDKDIHCIKWAKSVYPNLPFDNKIPGGKFDAIVCIGVVEHVFDTWAFLQNLKNLGEKDAIWWFQTPIRKFHDGSQDRRHVREWSVDEFRDVLRKYWIRCQLIESDGVEQLWKCQGKKARSKSC